MGSVMHMSNSRALISVGTFNSHIGANLKNAQRNVIPVDTLGSIPMEAK